MEAHHGAIRFASLRVFLGWLVDEGEIHESPMARMRKPKLSEQLAGIPTKDDLRKLLADCDALRDTAIVRTFIATGARLAEIAGLRLEDVNLDNGTITVMGKGRRERLSFLGKDAPARPLGARGRSAGASRRGAHGSRDRCPPVRDREDCRHHVSHILTKLGLSRRGEAAAIAHRLGLAAGA